MTKILIDQQQNTVNMNNDKGIDKLYIIAEQLAEDFSLFPINFNIIPFLQINYYYFLLVMIS